jgi:hypothetical protein
LTFANVSVQIGQDVSQRDLIVNLVQAIPKVYIGFGFVSEIGDGFPRVSDFGRNIGGCILLLFRFLFDFATCEESFELSEVPTNIIRLILIECRGTLFAPDWHNIGSHFFSTFREGLGEGFCKVFLEETEVRS